MEKNLISEKDIENKVVRKLIDLDYIFEIGVNKDVFQQIPRTAKERNKLKRKRPDFIIYCNNVPTAIIETKKPGGNLWLALQQAESYAKSLDINIIFAYDGFKMISKHLKFDKELQYGGTIITDFLPKELLVKFKDDYKVNLEFGKQISSEDEFIKEMANIEKLLRVEGLKAGDERFTEFAKILFLKLISQARKDYYSIWDSIVKTDRLNIIDVVNSKLKTVNREYKVDKYGETIKIKSPEIVEQIVKRLDKIDFINTSLDVKGSAFEYFLNYKGKNDDLAQYFTPREIVRFLIELVNPLPGETIYDPFCGSAGILIKAFDYVKNQIAKSDQKKILDLKKNSLFGTDISTIAYVAKMNMILAGDGHTNICRQENGSLVNKRTNQYDIVITNIPFTLPINQNIEGMMYAVHSSNGNSISIQHALDALNKKQGSRAAIIVPEQVIFSFELKETRKWLVENFKIDVFSLPQGIFLPYAIAKSCILYLEYTGSKSDINFINIKYVGYTPNRSKKPIPQNDLYNYIIDENSVEKTFISYESLSQNNYIFKPNYLNIDEENSHNFVKLSQIFSYSRIPTLLNDENYYSEVTVKNHGLGAVKRVYSKQDNITSLKGSEIKSKRFIIKNEDYIVSSLDARNGGFGKIKDSLRGSIYTSTYFCFIVKDEYKELDLDMLTEILASTKMKKYFTAISNGTTNRRSIKKEEFLKTKLFYSKKELLKMSAEYSEYNSEKEKLEKQVMKIKNSMRLITFQE